MSFIRLNTALTCSDENWTFIGQPGWKQDFEGMIYSPTWSLPNFDQGHSCVPNLYAHELAREDYAILSAQPLADTDVSVDYKCPYGSVIHGGVVFRAVDSSRFYVVDVTDMGRKGHYYELTLWRQEASGYRRELARGQVPHSIVPERFVQGTGVRTRQDWNCSSPDWVTVRIQASGTYVRVSVDARVVFDVRDRAYPAGCVGLVGRGSVLFRNFQAEGEPAESPAPWRTHQGELPRFFYPGGEQPEGYNACPVACRTEDGLTLVAWQHAPKLKDPAACLSVVLTRSEDEGRTWSRPEPIFAQQGSNCGCSSLFAHRDGTVSCLVGVTSGGYDPDAIPQTFVVRSADAGLSWTEPQEFTIAGKRLAAYRQRHGRLSLYGPMIRLSDARVVMCAYEVKTVPGGSVECNAERLDRSLLICSTDDGYTWEEPIYFDENNFDHNECMVAETEPGKLVAFMRTLSAPHMWTSSSEDGGRTWARLSQSNVSAECPFLLRHSSGALILGSRGYGTFLRLSFDKGRSWTEPFRLSPASAMMAMVEMADGRVLNIMHEGYRVPGHIRGQFFRVTPDGPVAAE